MFEEQEPTFAWNRRNNSVLQRLLLLKPAPMTEKCPRKLCPSLSEKISSSTARYTEWILMTVKGFLTVSYPLRLQHLWVSALAGKQPARNSLTSLFGRRTCAIVAAKEQTKHAVSEDINTNVCKNFRFWFHCVSTESTNLLMNNPDDSFYIWLDFQRKSYSVCMWI